VFAISFWLLFSLSKSYTYQIFGLLRFRNVPIKKGLSLPATQLVSVKIEGTGWSLFTSNKNSPVLHLEADLKGHRTRSYVGLREFIPEFNSQVPAGQRILEVEPDTLRFTYQNRQSKKIPLIFRFAISFDKQFYYKDPLANLPDSIWVSGPPLAIKKLEKWQTPLIQYTNLSHSVDTVVLLGDKRYPELLPEPAGVHFRVTVDQFTEKVLTLPIRLVHVRSGEEITLIPSSIQAYLLVPLSYFNMVRPESFDVTCDMDEWRFSRHAKLALKVLHAPAYLRVEKLFPPDIDFMVHR